jgi:hypothetical protein
MIMENKMYTSFINRNYHVNVLIKMHISNIFNLEHFVLIDENMLMLVTLFTANIKKGGGDTMLLTSNDHTEESTKW